MIFLMRASVEEVDVLGHVCDFLLDFGELGLDVAEVGLELLQLLRALLLLRLHCAFSLLH